MTMIKMIFVFLLPTISYAFFCPNNFNQINFGDTIAQIQQQCGTPAKQETKEIAPDIPTPQEWNYYVPRTYTLSATNQPEMTLKTQIIFDANGKAININVNGLSMPSTNVCGAVIQLGATQDTVKAACGNPAIINKQQATAPQTGSSQPPKNKITEFTYSTTPPVTLVFENGVLKSKK